MKKYTLDVDNQGDLPEGLPLTMDEFDNECKKLNEKNAVIALGSTTVVLHEYIPVLTEQRDIKLLSFRNFTDLMRNKKIEVFEPVGLGYKKSVKSIAQQWLSAEYRKEYDEIVFLPRENVSKKVYNLWRGFALEPLASNKSEPYWEHVEDVICDGNNELYLYVRKWMAHSVQKTDELPMTALVLRGQQGTGKGFFVNALEKIYGQHYMEFTDVEDIVGRFNSHLKDKIIIHANEALWGGDKRQEGTLKGLITESKRKCEMKGKDSFTVNNFSRLIVSSNNEWVVPADLDDRRYVFLNVSSCRKQDDIYFSALQDSLDNGGYEAILHDLMTEDITAFNPTIRPLIALTAGVDQKTKGMDTVTQFIEQWLQEGRLDDLKRFENTTLSGYYLLVIAHLYDEYLKHHKSVGYRKPAETKKAFSLQVFSGGTKPALLPYHGKCQRNVWIHSENKYRKLQVYALPTLDECRTHFEDKVVCSGWVWDDVHFMDSDLEKSLLEIENLKAVESNLDQVINSVENG